MTWHHRLVAPARRRHRARDRRAALCRRHPARQRAARQTGSLGLRARAHRRVITTRRRVPGVRSIFTAAICRSRFRATGRLSPTGRCWRSARRNSRASRSRPSPQKRRMPRAARRRSSASISRSCRPFCRSRPARPAAPLVQDPALRPERSAAAHEHAAASGSSAGATSPAPPPISSSRTTTRSRWSRTSRSSRTRFLPPPDANGVTIWSPIQHPYVLQRVVAAALDWPVSRVRIIAPDPGGGFGGKGWPKFEPLMAFLALRTGRPVRLVLTLEETFQAVRRTSARIHARTGFASDGRIVFQDIEADFLLGAYADIGARVVSKASYAACGPYRPRTPASSPARCSRTRRRARRSADSARRRRPGPSSRN